MAEMATYVGITPRTIINNLAGGALARGVRVFRQADGTCIVAPIGQRGDYVTLTSIEAGKPGAAVSAAGGGKVPALAAEATVVGNPAYSAANGQFSQTSTGAVLMGRWTLAASGPGILGEVELLDNP